MASWCKEVADFIRVIKKAHQEWFIEKWISGKYKYRHLQLICERVELQQRKDEKIAKVVAAIKPFLGGMAVERVKEIALTLLEVAEPFKENDDVFPPHKPWWYEDSSIHPGMVGELVLRRELRDVFYDCMECVEYYNEIVPLFRDKEGFTLITDLWMNLV